MSKSPIFIVGCPRSGTTLIRMVLDSHSHIAIAPESSYLLRMNRFLWLYGDISKFENFNLLVKDLVDIRRVRDWFPEDKSHVDIINALEGRYNFPNAIREIFTAYARSRKKSRWGDKTPKNLFAVPEILTMFPDAKIIAVIRDGRDVALSLKKADFGKVSLVHGANEWRKYATKLKDLLSAYPNNILKIHYEDFLLNNEVQLREVFSFIDEDFEQDILLKYQQHDDDVRHTKSSFFGKPIEKDNILKWRNELSLKEQRLFESVAHDALKVFGYETNYNSKGSSFYKFYYSISKVVRLTNKVYLRNYLDVLQLLIIRSLGRFATFLARK